MEFGERWVGTFTLKDSTTCLKAEVKQHSISLKQDKRGPGSKLAITANRSLSEVVRTQNEKKNSLQIKVLATMDLKI